ncbi:unnamed protein product [Pleuronectes platessa]|uniref:Uncharacterized protein n=1 Tax=Pleuronectes platessa TaxID=8262 RepID=A0A9N7Y191_PLEPL|nr:unnamed protein product [Pleuronectes platessa]
MHGSVDSWSEWKPASSRFDAVFVWPPSLPPSCSSDSWGADSRKEVSGEMADRLVPELDARRDAEAAAQNVLEVHTSSLDLGKRDREEESQGTVCEEPDRHLVAAAEGRAAEDRTQQQDQRSQRGATSMSTAPPAGGSFPRVREHSEKAPNRLVQHLPPQPVSQWPSAFSCPSPPFPRPPPPPTIYSSSLIPCPSQLLVPPLVSRRESVIISCSRNQINAIYPNSYKN